MDFDNLSNMHGMVRVYFDPDIDVYSDFTTKYQTSSDEKGVFYDVWGYDNELEEDFWYLNPIDRVSKLNSLPEADRRSLELNIKKNYAQSRLRQVLLHHCSPPILRNKLAY